MPANKQDVHESVTDYLSSLVWDGTPRLDRWLIDCGGARALIEFHAKKDVPNPLVEK